MTDDLKPCPFCGEIDTIIRNGTVEDDWCAVSCEKCYSQGPHQYTDPHAIAAWNTRAAIPDPECHDTIAALRAEVDALRAQVMPPEPTDAQINSACLSYRHDFGLLDDEERAKVRFHAVEWLRAWRKATGTY